MKSISIVSAVCLLAFSTAASATSISIGAFSASNLAAATGGLANVVTEDFEALGTALGEGEVTPGSVLATNVGGFETAGGTGTGGTVSQLAGNTGQNVALRDGNVFGRTNTTQNGSFFLDSNDTFGIGWNVDTGQLFDTIVFTVRDASEFSFLRIMADGVEADQRVGARFADGSTSLVEINLDTAVTSFRIDLENFTSLSGLNAANDGFSIDDISVGLAVVPVPASLPLLMVGVGAFAFQRRKQRKTV